MAVLERPPWWGSVCLLLIALVDIGLIVVLVDGGTSAPAGPPPATDIAPVTTVPPTPSPEQLLPTALAAPAGLDLVTIHR